MKYFEPGYPKLGKYHQSFISLLNQYYNYSTKTMTTIINIKVPLHTQVIKLMNFVILLNKFNYNL